MKLFKDISILKVINRNISRENDIVINEKLYSIRINKEEILSLYCLPIYIEEFVAGILYQEKIITTPDSIRSISIDDNLGVIDISIKLKNDNISGLEKLKRLRFLTPDCTNPSSLSSLNNQIVCEPIQTDFIIKLDSIHLLLKQFEKMAELYRSTGSTHSAALCSETKILFYNEDISRHNCIDKLVGWAFLKIIDLSDKIIITTGRLTATMVTKAIKTSVAILISRSAATWEAIKIADRYNLAMASFARCSRINIYSHPERFSL